MSAARWYVLAAIIGLGLICVTVLAALKVVPGERVLDLLGTAIAAFVGALAGSRNGKGTSLRPPPRALYPPKLGR